MKKIIYVPGKNPKPPADLHRQHLLRCLVVGLRRINPQVAEEIPASDCFSLAAWNRHFHESTPDVSQVTTWVDQLLTLEDYKKSDRDAVRTVSYGLPARFTSWVTCCHG